MSVFSESSLRFKGAALVVTLLAVTTTFAGCSFGGSRDTVDLGSGQVQGATPPVPPTAEPLVIITPEAWPTPVGTPALAAYATPDTTVTDVTLVTTQTPTVNVTRATTLTPTPGVTPATTASPRASATPGPTLPAATKPTVAPSGRLPELARSLDDRVAALSQALAAKDVAKALQLQRDLLSDATSGETALQLDKSAQADLVRQAISDIRAGAAGDTARLDSARAKLAAALGQATSSGGASTSTTAMASSLQTKLNSLQQAKSEQRVDAVLKLQQELLQEVSQDQKAIASRHDENTDRLRSVLQDLHDGLSGDESKLQAASSELQSLSSAGSAASPQQRAASVQLQNEASSLDNKIANLTQALSGGNSDQLLRAQRELLDEIAKAGTVIQGNNSDQAGRIRDALALAQSGASGDVAKLDEARSRLADATGSPSNAQSQPDQTGQTEQRVRPSDLPRIADDLSRQVDDYKAALQKGDRQALLRLQPQLLDEVNRYEQAVRGISGQQGDQMRSALSDLRNALGGDPNKLNSANASLRLVAGSAEPPSPSPAAQQP